MPDEPTPPPPALPWHHPTLAALALAIGTTARTLDLWRADGAPIGTEGPHDELAVRIWHAARIPGNGKVKPLSDPAGAVATYCALLPARPTADPATDSASLIKQRQVAKLDQQLARGAKTMERQAQEAFKDLLGSMTKDLQRSLSGGILDGLFASAQQSRLRAQRSLRRNIETFFDGLLDRALRRIK